MRHQGLLQYILLLLWLVQPNIALSQTTASTASTSPTSRPDFAVIRQALQQALDLRFDQGIATAAQLEEEQQPTLASNLTRGMIAYFQSRWQTRQSPTAQKAGHKALMAVLEEGKRRLEQSQEEPWLKLLLGTAAIFDALLQQSEAPWKSVELFGQGRSWLQQALIAHEAAIDAHLGLGLLYFAGSTLPAPLQRLLGGAGKPSTLESIHHLQRAAAAGQFSPEVARTFLARLYEQEQRYEEAIALGLKLQQAFPNNGYYALLIGRSQCAHNRYTQCATTLGQLAAQLTASSTVLVQRDDRFDLYYAWGQALNELKQYDQAFQAFRRAINQDTRAVKDDTLRAKFHLARLYEHRGQQKTARQIYRTLLRGRNVDDLHQRAERRLGRLR